MYLATLSLFIYIFTKISADLYAGSLFLTLSIPELNIYLAVIILLAITVVYAIAGGLKAVIYVEALQTVVMVIGAIILAVTAFTEINGEDVDGNNEGQGCPDRAKNSGPRTGYVTHRHGSGQP